MESLEDMAYGRQWKEVVTILGEGKEHVSDILTTVLGGSTSLLLSGELQRSATSSECQRSAGITPFVSDILLVCGISHVLVLGKVYSRINSCQRVTSYCRLGLRYLVRSAVWV